MIDLAGPLNSGAAVGADGSATANRISSMVLHGCVLGIHVKYNDSPPAATTDVTIATAGINAPAQTLLTLTDQATDVWKYPRMIPHDLAGVALATLVIAEPIPISDKVKITIAQANAADNVDVWLLMGE